MERKLTNLKTETLAVLEKNGKATHMIWWAGNRDGEIRMTPEAFLFLAEKTNYSNEMGGVKIAKDLVVVGEGWWLERHEYDGAEWWEYKENPSLGTSLLRRINEVGEINFVSPEGESSCTLFDMQTGRNQESEDSDYWKDFYRS